MARRLIDLSMRVHNDMVAFPRVVRPSMAMYETWEQFAQNIGAAKHGVDWLTASYLVVTGDHIGTHIDSLRHLRDDAPGPRAFRSSTATATASASISGTSKRARASPSTT